MSNGAYHPPALGAQCSLCLLNTDRIGGPIPPEIGVRAEVAIVGEGPGPEDIKQGRPFMGPPGQELETTLRLVGLSRPQGAYFTAFSCAVPDSPQKRGDYEALEKKRKKLNKLREAYNKDLPPAERVPMLLSPVEACRPRLLNETRSYQDIITVGAKGLHGITGTPLAVTAVRGGMLDGWLDDPQGETRFVRAEGLWASVSPTGMGRRLRLLPTVHPAFVQRARRWTKVFRADLGRALRWFRGALAWQEPQIVYRPSADDLYRFLYALGNEALAYDTETDGLEPLTANMRCVGIGDGNTAYVMPFLSKDGNPDVFTGTGPGFYNMGYDPAEKKRVIDVLRAWFVDPNRVKVGHNIITYDSHVVYRFFGVRPKPLIDTLTLHRLVESELPHNLGFVASLYADISPAWKADRTATTAENDYDLHKYCAYDVVLNHRVTQPLVDAVQVRAQIPCFKLDTQMGEACAGMHRVGMYIDQKRRAQWEYTLSIQTFEWLQRCRDISGIKDLNPGSVQQIRDLLYNKFGLAVPNGTNGKPKMTAGGDPSTDDEAIRALMMGGGLSQRVLDFLQALRMYRAKSKLLGTYITKLRPSTVLASDPSGLGLDIGDVEERAAELGLSLDEFLQTGVDEYEEAEKRAKDKHKQKERKRGLVDPKTGRVYPQYSQNTVVGRIAASGPNTLNIPADLRDLFIAAPGHILVGADMDQLHLRIAASLWNLQKYLRALALGADPHATTAYLVHGEAFRTSAGVPAGSWIDNEFFVMSDPNGKWGKPAKGMRDIAKRVQYGAMYKAMVETLWRVIQSAEDNDGKLLYLAMKLPEVRLMFEAWIGGIPELAVGWQKEIDHFTKFGFVLEPVLGRRRDFLDSHNSDRVNENELVNFPVIGAEAAIMGKATVAVVDELPFEYAGPGTGLIQQNYDSMILEVPECDAARGVACLERHMNRSEPALPGVMFTAKAQPGRSWKDT